MQSSAHTILIVDDVATNLDLLKGLLIDQYNIKVATNGPLAIKIAQLDPGPDLILLDVMMPGMDGFQVCERLKSEPRTQEIPIIFLTAKTETDAIVKGFESGGVDYLTKPFNPHELLARVNTQILLKQQKDLILRQNHEQKELLHVLSHDLANHFGIISMALELFKTQPERAEYYWTKIKTATRHGIDTIDLVREMRALEEKKLRLERLNLSAVLHETILLLGERFEQKRVKLNINVHDDIWIQAEKRSFTTSVINNLLTNALKFSFPDNAVDVTASEAGAMVTISIEDRGIGIPATMLEHLFDMSKSISRPGTQGEIGTGFGMSLVKSFVEFYGGTIEVNSQDIQVSPDAHGTQILLHLQKSSPGSEQ